MTNESKIKLYPQPEDGDEITIRYKPKECEHEPINAFSVTVYDARVVSKTNWSCKHCGKKLRPTAWSVDE